MNKKSLKCWLQHAKKSWHNAWHTPAYTYTFLVNAIVLGGVLAFFPSFFAIIEARDGNPMQDQLLNYLPAVDVSGVIFALIWGTALLCAVRLVNQPKRLLRFMISYLFVCLTRMLTIWLVPLEPPKDLIELIDPLSNAFYNGSFVTKDLFYSGHTATVFLMYLVMQKRWDRRITLLATVLVGVGVLVQHVHYTIDVLAAPFFAYLAWWLAGKITARLILRNSFASAHQRHGSGSIKTASLTDV